MQYASLLKSVNNTGEEGVSVVLSSWMHLFILYVLTATYTSVRQTYMLDVPFILYVLTALVAMR